MVAPGIQKQSRKGKMVVICSAKGGVGKTTLAVNLAIALYKKKLQIALMDGDFQFGDVNVAMDLESSFSISDVAERMEILDSFSLNNYMYKHTSGVRVLSAPKRPELADLITPEIIDKVSQFILEDYHYLIVDTGVGINDQTLTLIEKADVILLLTTLELISIKNTKRMLQILQTLEMHEKVKVVLNRSTMESVIQADQVPQILQIEHLYFIPNNFQVASKSLNLGIPFVINQPSCDLSKAIFKVAEHLDSNEPMAMPKKKTILEKMLSANRQKRRE
ncbi:CpaE family protein [Ectobacillus sp. sgz5001026]|uniref:AAA family ATPase n=1 Tax=Ectobacillus sp. sgz5001026 TaxID=3242473 RepID=UPI0036D25CB1